MRRRRKGGARRSNYSFPGFTRGVRSFRETRRLVDKVYSVNSSSFSCRLFINKLKTKKDKKKTKKKIHDDDDDDDENIHWNENEDDKVYLG